MLNLELEPIYLRAVRLFWPSKTDFVRVAARFDAVVVPFAGVGADDNVKAGELFLKYSFEKRPLC